MTDAPAKARVSIVVRNYSAGPIDLTVGMRHGPPKGKHRPLRLPAPQASPDQGRGD